ncbi:family 47 glycoside hydrolase [Melampsora americana]|nr:family 47 glycoside hydrolase [Melampsora americana]
MKFYLTKEPEIVTMRSQLHLSTSTSKHIFIIFLILFNSLSTIDGIKIQADHIRSGPDSQIRANRIRDLFKKGWSTYRAHAWGHDEIGALSLKPSDTRNGWGATLVDSLSTLQVMKLHKEYTEAIQHIQSVDFTQTKTRVSVFESTIRYVGGLLSAYEGSARTDQILVTKATQLADQIMYAWQNMSILPFPQTNFTNQKPILDSNGNITNIAEAGSLILEFYKLSKYSSNSTYFDKAEIAMKAIIKNQPIWPGLHSVWLDPIDARPIADSVTWGPAADSFYEYLNKYSLLTGNVDTSYLTHWALAVDSSIKNLIRTSAATSRPLSTSYNIPFFSSSSTINTKERTFLASREPHGSLSYGMTHLDCFVGGNFMLGGKMLKNQTIVDYGLKLIETCADSYLSTRSGVGPEIFDFIDKETRKSTASSGIDLKFYDEHGYMPSEGYYLRPEVIESVFYAYRITGDPIWQEIGWKMWTSIEECCLVSNQTGLFAYLNQVNQIPSRNFTRSLALQKDGWDGWEDGPFRESPEYGDFMESFWWAETMK